MEGTLKRAHHDDDVDNDDVDDVADDGEISPPALKILRPGNDWQGHERGLAVSDDDDDDDDDAVVGKRSGSSNAVRGAAEAEDADEEGLSADCSSEAVAISSKPRDGDSSVSHAADAADVADADATDCPLTPLDSLGDEIVIKIFSYLSTRDLLRSACRVCRKWHRLTRAPELWRHIVLDVSKLRLRDTERNGPDYRPHLIDDRILSSLTSLSRGILSVDLTDCNALSCDALIAMSSRCGQLRSLNMTRCSTNATNPFLVQLAANCPLLEEVVLDQCACDDDAVRALVSSCPRLSKLSLADNSAISDPALDHIANFAANLKFLSLDRRQIVSPIGLITDAGLVRLSEGCPQLEHLNISGLPGLSAKGILALARLRRLKSLDVARVRVRGVTAGVPAAAAAETSLTDAILAVVDANARGLDSLNVSIVKRIDDAFVEKLARKAKTLRQLFILDSAEMTDRGLEALADHCLHLSKLDVSWCRKLTNEGVTYLVSKRPTLRLLGLIRCDNVTDACVDHLMSGYPAVEFQTFTLGCRSILMRAKAAGGTASPAAESNASTA